jgi:putative membrane protein
MRILLRLLASAVALAVATAVVPGIELQTASLESKTLTLIGVALIFGVINAILKPIVKIVGCAFYVLTLGLVGLVVNGLLLWLTSWLAGKLKLPFHITGFWPAFWGAIIVGLVGWLLGILIRDRGEKAESRPHSSPA